MNITTNSEGKAEYKLLTLGDQNPNVNNNSKNIGFFILGGEISCFLGETKILTTEGEVRIDNLTHNHKLISGDGRIIDIKAIKTINTKNNNTLCKIPKGLFNSNEDTYLSKYHAIFNGRRFITLQKKQIYEKYKVETYDYITYYNIELFDKMNDTFIANNIIVEGNNQKGKFDYMNRNRNIELMDILKKSF